jgi:hypothetical protein
VLLEGQRDLSQGLLNGEQQGRDDSRAARYWRNCCLPGVTVFARVSGYRQAIRRWAEFLTEDALRAMARRQSSIAGMAATAIGELEIKAIEARARDTLFAVDPRQLLVTTSDLQGILVVGDTLTER